MLMNGGERKGVLMHDMFRDLLQKGKIAFPSITEAEIKDRSKADSLAKGISVLQTTWFIAQCISRKVEGLITTEVELITLAFAVLNKILYFLWWNKPLDVKCCMPVFLLDDEDCKPVVIPSFEPKSKLFYYYIVLRDELRNTGWTWQLFAVLLLVAGHETTKVSHSIPKSKFISDRFGNESMKCTRMASNLFQHIFMGSYVVFELPWLFNRLHSW